MLAYDITSYNAGERIAITRDGQFVTIRDKKWLLETYEVFTGTIDNEENVWRLSGEHFRNHELDLFRLEVFDTNGIPVEGSYGFGILTEGQAIRVAKNLKINAYMDDFGNDMRGACVPCLRPIKDDF